MAASFRHCTAKAGQTPDSFRVRRFFVGRAIQKACARVFAGSSRQFYYTLAPHNRAAVAKALKARAVRQNDIGRDT